MAGFAVFSTLLLFLRPSGGFSLAEYFLLTVVSDGLGAYGIWENLRSHKWQKNQEHQGLISSGLTKESTDKLFYLI